MVNKLVSGGKSSEQYTSNMVKQLGTPNIHVWLSLDREFWSKEKMQKCVETGVVIKGLWGKRYTAPCGLEVALWWVEGAAASLPLACGFSLVHSAPH